MTEGVPQSAQEFEHYHEHYVRDIKDTARAVRESASTPEQVRVGQMFDSFFGADAPFFMAEDDAKPDAEQVLKKAMSKLSDASHLELVVSNLLEGVKSGRALEELVVTYEKLGLLRETRPLPGAPPPNPTRQPDGSFLERALGQARKLGTLLWRLGANAVRTIPRFAKLKPKVRFGFVGPLPTFSLDFDLEADGLTLHELGDLLTRGLGATR